MCWETFTAYGGQGHSCAPERFLVRIDSLHAGQ
jgi:hypothetical protein